MIIATGILAFSDITGKDVQGVGYSHDGNMIGSVTLFLADGTSLVLSARDHYMLAERRKSEGRPDKPTMEIKMSGAADSGDPEDMERIRERLWEYLRKPHDSESVHIIKSLIIPAEHIEENDAPNL